MAGDRQAILGFFKKVMDASPIPVMIYNFPYVDSVTTTRAIADWQAVPHLESISLPMSSLSLPSTQTVSVPRYAYSRNPTESEADGFS